MGATTLFLCNKLLTYCLLCCTHTLQNVEKIKHARNTPSSKFVNKWFLDILPDILHEPFDRLISKFATTISNQQRYNNEIKNKYNHLKTRLQIHGLSEHGLINPNSNDPTTKWRRNNAFKKCEQTINNNLSNNINLQEIYLLDNIKRNPHVFNVVEPYMQKLWIQEHNKIIRQEALVSHKAIKKTLSGLLNRFTNRQWNALNRSVQYIYYDILCTHMINICIYVY